MPHTSHKKKNAFKKLKQTVGEDGWTRVTSSTKPPPAPKQTDAPDAKVLYKWSLDGKEVSVEQRVLTREVPRRGWTIEKLQGRFKQLQAQWLKTDSCKALEQALCALLASSKGKINNCVVFGTASFCGVLSRDEVALIQLAVFKTTIDTIEKVNGERPSCFAQDPLYNRMDVVFLESMGITQVEHPDGFTMLDRNSLVYSPYVPRWLDVQIAYYNPGIWLHRSFDHWFETAPGSKLSDDQCISYMGERFDWPKDDVRRHEDILWEEFRKNNWGPRLREEHEINCQIIRSFQKSHTATKLPDADFENDPFSSVILWSPQHEDG